MAPRYKYIIVIRRPQNNSRELSVRNSLAGFQELRNPAMVIPLFGVRRTVAALLEGECGGPLPALVDGAVERWLP